MNSEMSNVIDMNQRDLEKLSQAELVKMVEKMQKKAKKPKTVMEDDDHKQTSSPIAQSQKTPKHIPPRDPKTGRFVKIHPDRRKPPKEPALSRLSDAKGRFVSRRQSQPVVQQPPIQIRENQKAQKPIGKQRQPSEPRIDELFNFDNDIFQTENESLGKFKIINVRSTQNKNFKSFTNEFKVKILKKLDDVKEIYHIFQELIIKTVKRKRKLNDNDRLRFVIQNEELPNTISTKFNKVKDFKLGDLEKVIKIPEYRNIPLENWKIVVQSVKIPNGKGRLYLSKDTVSRKNCIIMVKNDDTICLGRAIITAYANLKPKRWSKTQLQNGFKCSRKLQRDQATKLHKDADIEINDYGNDLSDVEIFAKHIVIEINIIDAEQLNRIVYTANKGTEDKIYLLKTRNHFDVIKSLTAFYDTPYYCHECKKAYTKRDKHKCPPKCLSCFKMQKIRNVRVTK